MSFNRNKVTELLKDYVDETGIHYSVDRIEKVESMLVSIF